MYATPFLRPKTFWLMGKSGQGILWFVVILFQDEKVLREWMIHQQILEQSKPVGLVFILFFGIFLLLLPIQRVCSSLFYVVTCNATIGKPESFKLHISDQQSLNFLWHIHLKFALSCCTMHAMSLFFLSETPTFNAKKSNTFFSNNFCYTSQSDKEHKNRIMLTFISYFNYYSPANARPLQ